MSITSVLFFALFVIVFAVYYILSKNGKAQNWWLLITSYLFYGYCEWRTLPLLVIATVIFYYAGIAIARDNGLNERRASLWTTLSVVFGVGILVYFKYLNFLVDAFTSLLNLTGLNIGTTTLSIIMPLGISFYTFRLIAYSIEVYRGHVEPCKDFVAFAAYVAFFPTILSGPIDRPKAFLDQLARRRPFNYDMGVEGCKLILWGLFMKLLIADSIAEYTSYIGDKFSYHNGGSILLSSLLYPIELYTDFCGYSNVAIGLGLLLGIKVAENFRRPFFAKNVAKYWRRWHISLTGWLTDYIFLPLNLKFRDWGNMGIMLAVMINFVAIGMWHGANWTYVLFGVYYGLLYIPLIASGKFMEPPKKVKGLALPSFTDVLKMVCTYLLVALGLIIFRAANVGDAFAMIGRIFTDFGIPPLDYMGNKKLLFLFMILIFCKDIYDEYLYGHILFMERRWTKRIGYVLLVLLLLFFSINEEKDFVYVNF